MSMATLEKVHAQIAKLQAQAEALLAKQSSGVIARIRELMEKHGLTTADIEAHIGEPKTRARQRGGQAASKAPAAAAKYRDPKSGAAWSGRGRAPAWIANAKDRSKFLADGNLEAPNATGKTAAKAGNYVRGPQAAKYRDPATGTTWSGRGRAPAWIADAKDRTAFLIEATGEGDAKPKAAKKKTASQVESERVGAKEGAAKTAATKKVAAKKNVVSAKKAPAKKASTRKLTARKGAARKAAASPEAVAPASAPTSAAGEKAAG